MKVRKISIFNQLFIMLAILLLIGNGILGVVACRHSEDALFEQIQANGLNIARSAAAHVDGALLKEIEAGDEGTEEYEQIVEQLALFRDNTEIEYIYTLRQLKDGSAVFVVDSDPEEPASIGDECELTDALALAFSKGLTIADDESFTDEWGTHLSAYSPIYVDGEVIGVIGLDLSASWIEEQTGTLRNMVIMVCAITYVVSLVILGVIMLKFRKSMGKLNDKVSELVGGAGDLTKEIDIRTGDELEVIADNMNAFIRQIRKLMNEVADSAAYIVATGDELNVTVNKNARIMSDMNSEIDGISSNMEISANASKQLSVELSESAQGIAAFAEQVNKITNKVSEASKNAQQSVGVVKTNRELALKSIDELSARMKKTSEDAKKIAEVRKIATQISEIASQTNMLSLNAQIEAARAGEQGKGFVVVATEVGKLSKDIDKSVAEINEINEVVVSALEALISVSEEMIEFVSVNVVNDYDIFAGIGEDYGNTTETIGTEMVSIEEKSAEISKTISEINHSVQEITATVLSTADSANDLANATKTISESMEHLNDTSGKNIVHTENLNEQLSRYVF